MNTTIPLLERLAALIQTAVRDDAARHGLLPIHLQVLAYLGVANRYSDLPIAVAEYFGITRGTVSQTLAVLERRGLITKMPDARHGRRIHLQLTHEGEALLAGSWPERLDAALAASGAASVGLEDALRALLSALQQLNRNQAFGVCRQCVHFRREDGGRRCGLTGEPLALAQTHKICREWTAPAASSSEVAA